MLRSMSSTTISPSALKRFIGFEERLKLSSCVITFVHNQSGMSSNPFQSGCDGVGFTHSKGRHND